MAELSVHCNDCRKLLGYDYREVHEWLDEFGDGKSTKHRKKRHTDSGIQTIRSRWGYNAQQAGLIHIYRDLDGFCPYRGLNGDLIRLQPDEI